MTVKETIHEWIESMPEDSPKLVELLEQARLNLAVEEARRSVREGRTIPIDEVIARREEKCRVRHSG
jgi:hypothetical protein